MGVSSSSQREEVKERAIESLQHAYVKLGPSTVEGVGVFALRDVAEGVEVMRWDWHRYRTIPVHETELESRVPRQVFVQLRRIWHVDAQGHVQVPVDFTATLSYVNFLNHSDEPNLSFRYSDGVYSTTRAVAEGEELFISYDQSYYPGYTAAFRERESGQGAPA